MKPGGPVELEITDNTCTVVSFTHRGGSWQVRLHHMFHAAEDELLTHTSRATSGARAGPHRGRSSCC